MKKDLNFYNTRLKELEKMRLIDWNMQNKDLTKKEIAILKLLYNAKQENGIAGLKNMICYLIDAIDFECKELADTIFFGIIENTIKKGLEDRIENILK